MKAKVVDIDYCKPEISFPIREWKTIRRYLGVGYYITSRENGMCVLMKSSQIVVTFEKEDGKKEIVDVKNILKKFYGKKKKGRELFKLLQKDFEAGTVYFKEDSKGKYSIVRV